MHRLDCRREISHHERLPPLRCLWVKRRAPIKTRRQTHSDTYRPTLHLIVHGALCNVDWREVKRDRTKVFNTVAPSRGSQCIRIVRV